jgi:hypothetical protein
MSLCHRSGNARNFGANAIALQVPGDQASDQIVLVDRSLERCYFCG